MPMTPSPIPAPIPILAPVDRPLSEDGAVVELADGLEVAELVPEVLVLVLVALVVVAVAAAACAKKASWVTVIVTDVPAQLAFMVE